MRFGKQVSTVAIPQWKECYLDYGILKIFVIIIKEAVQAIAYCDQIRKQVVSYQDYHYASDNEQLAASPLIELDQIRKLLVQALDEQNQVFYKIYICQTEITELFYQMKVLQMQDKIEFCQRIKPKKLDKQLLPLFLTYIEYVYVQVHYVSEMRQVNMIGDKKILKKHKKNAKKMVQTPKSSYSKINRIATIQSQYMQKIQDLFIQVNKGNMESKEAREFLRQAAHKAQVDYMDYFLFGLGVGATLILLSTLIFIIKIQNLDIESRSDSFARDFPTWRGVALFIFYIWILGFNLYCFERYKISHRLIFKFEDHHYSTSSQIFKTAGIFTTLFMVVFLIYLLIQSRIIKITPFIGTQYFVLIIWSSLGVYLFMPFKIFNYEGRIYAIKLILKSLVAPIFEPQFTIVWITDQWNSMITPLRDLFYTVCYYQVLDFKNLNSNPCKDNSSFTFVMLPLVIAISYKIFQSIRKGYNQGKYFMTQYMGATIKYLFSLATAFISFVYNQGQQNLLVIWIISSIVSTIFSYYWDLKYDWGLLEPKCKNWLLRKYLTFEPKRNYYIIICANFIMRWSWTITLSPSISAYFGSPSLLRLITGSVQIVRRGIWNLLKVEKEHLKNCNQFKAVPDMKFIEEKLEGKPSKVNNNEISFIGAGGIQEFDNLSMKVKEDRKKQYISLIKKKIQQRETQQKSYTKAYKKQKQNYIKQQRNKINKIKNKLDEYYQIGKQ